MQFTKNNSSYCVRFVTHFSLFYIIFFLIFVLSNFLFVYLSCFTHILALGHHRCILVLLLATTHDLWDRLCSYSLILYIFHYLYLLLCSITLLVYYINADSWLRYLVLHVTLVLSYLCIDRRSLLLILCFCFVCAVYSVAGCSTLMLLVLLDIPIMVVSAFYKDESNARKQVSSVAVQFGRY